MADQPPRAPTESKPENTLPRLWWRSSMLAGLFHAVIMVLACEPFNLWPLTCVAIIPLVWLAARVDVQFGAVRRKRTTTLLLLAIWAGALPFQLFEQAWLAEVTPPGYPLMAAYLTIYPPVFVVLLARLKRRFVRVPLGVLAGIAWTAVNIFHGDLLFKGYAWFNIAHPLVNWPPLAMPAAVVGTYGVTLLLATCAASVYAIATNSDRMRHLFLLAATVGVWGGLSVLGTTARSEPGDGRHTPSVRLGIVQTNLPQSNKLAPSLDSTLGLWRDLERLSRAAAETLPAPDAIIWPETMKPGLALDAESVKAEREARITLFPRDRSSSQQPVPTASFADRTVELQSSLEIPLIVGEDAYDGLKFTSDARGGLEISYRHRFNSAFLVTGGRVQELRYDKVRLTPFGEEMPYISAWPWLERTLMDLAARGMRLDLSSGRDLTVLKVPAASGGVARLVTPICFEATESALCRRMVFDGAQRRADLLVNMTNDGWFGWWRGGRLQSFQIARWRCIELRTPMFRAANTGISGVIDASGRVLSVFADSAGRDWGFAGQFVGSVPLSAGVPLFARGGWTVQWIIFAIGIVLIALAFILRPAAGRT